MSTDLNIPQCDCSDEYGPCEQHGDTLVVRQGASLHTADELTLLLIEDLSLCGVKLSSDDGIEFNRLASQLSADTDPHSGCGWFSDPDDQESAQDLARRTENSADGLWIVSEDGYRIVRPHDDCPLLADVSAPEPIEPAPNADDADIGPVRRQIDGIGSQGRYFTANDPAPIETDSPADPRETSAPVPDSGITAEIGTSGSEVTLELDGRAAVDIAAAIGAEHRCEDDSSCDIARALEDGYSFWSAQLLTGATETPLLDAVISHYCAHGLDMGAAADLDRDEWLSSETWTKHAQKCDSCGSITFGDDDWTADTCGSCGAGGLVPVALEGFDVDGFVHGYLDGILFTESLDATGYGPEDRSELADLEEEMPGDSSLLDYGASRENFTAEAVAEIRAECLDFLKAEIADIREYCELKGDWQGGPDSFGRTSYSVAECAGTDFWLSRNGHGAGYFDRGNEPVFARLQGAARVYGETSVYFDGDEITV